MRLLQLLLVYTVIVVPISIKAMHQAFDPETNQYTDSSKLFGKVVYTKVKNKLPKNVAVDSGRYSFSDTNKFDFYELVLVPMKYKGFGENYHSTKISARRTQRTIKI
jgi:hypothetical protein